MPGRRRCTIPRIDVKIRFLQGEIEREITFAGISARLRPESRHFPFLPSRALWRFESVPVAGASLSLHRPHSESERRHRRRLFDALDSYAAGRSRRSFVSLLDPPEDIARAAGACRNIGTWPVLAGREGERSLMLSSPIILYDYPQIAPESAGDFFDGTEIDEILTLRVLTLSDDEKQEVREGDDRGARHSGPH